MLIHFLPLGSLPRDKREHITMSQLNITNAVQNMLFPRWGERILFPSKNCREHDYKDIVAKLLQKNARGNPIKPPGLPTVQRPRLGIGLSRYYLLVALPATAWFLSYTPGIVSCPLDCSPASIYWFSKHLHSVGRMNVMRPRQGVVLELLGYWTSVLGISSGLHGSNPPFIKWNNEMYTAH